jgi:hypothetical protein
MSYMFRPCFDVRYTFTKKKLETFRLVPVSNGRNPFMTTYLYHIYECFFVVMAMPPDDGQ